MGSDTSKFFNQLKQASAEDELSIALKNVCTVKIESKVETVTIVEGVFLRFKESLDTGVLPEETMIDLFTVASKTLTDPKFVTTGISALMSPYAIKAIKNNPYSEDLVIASLSLICAIMRNHEVLYQPLIDNGLIDLCSSLPRMLPSSNGVAYGTAQVFRFIGRFINYGECINEKLVSVTMEMIKNLPPAIESLKKPHDDDDDELYDPQFKGLEMTDTLADVLGYIIAYTMHDKTYGWYRQNDVQCIITNLFLHISNDDVLGGSISQVSMALIDSEAREALNPGIIAQVVERLLERGKKNKNLFMSLCSFMTNATCNTKIGMELVPLLERFSDIILENFRDSFDVFTFALNVFGNCNDTGDPRVVTKKAAEVADRALTLAVDGKTENEEALSSYLGELVVGVAFLFTYDFAYEQFVTPEMIDKLNLIEKRCSNDKLSRAAATLRRDEDEMIAKANKAGLCTNTVVPVCADCGFKRHKVFCPKCCIQQKFFICSCLPVGEAHICPTCYKLHHLGHKGKWSFSPYRCFCTEPMPCSDPNP